MPDQLHATLLALLNKLGGVVKIKDGEDTIHLWYERETWCLDWYDKNGRRWKSFFESMISTVRLHLIDAGLERLRERYITTEVRYMAHGVLITLTSKGHLGRKHYYEAPTLAKALLLAVDVALTNEGELT